MSKIVILSHWRVGSTNFKKTLEQITGQEFWNEPDFDKHKNTIKSMGFEKFMEKSKWKSMKCDFVKSQNYLKEIIDYADMVFLLLRKDIGAQVDSYYKLEGIKLTRYEIMSANKKMKGLVQLHPNHRILYYENIVDFLSKKEKN
jgi:hypothetical protein